SGHRWAILLLMLLQLTFVGCQADGAGQVAWNPFRPKMEAGVDADLESRDLSRTNQFFARRQDSTEVADSVPPMATEQLERLLSQGRLALQENHIEDAKKAYGEVLQSLPDNATAHHGLAMAADLTERWDEAEYHYRQALRIRPKDPDLLCDMGYSYLLQNRYSEAESYLTHALEVSPQHESSLMNLAMLDLRQGKRASAERRLADHFGSTGGAAQVMAQLEEQVASLGGSVIPAAVSSNSAGGPGNSAFRPDLDDSGRIGMAGTAAPEIPANASLEEVLALARREGAEAERRRVALNSGRDQATAVSTLPDGSVSHSPSVSAGNSQLAADQNLNPLLSDRTVSPQSTGENFSARSSRPTHIFGTIQPRNTGPSSFTSESAGVSGTTVVQGSQSANGWSVDQSQWSDVRPVSATPGLQGNVVGSNEINTQATLSSNIGSSPSADVVAKNSESIAGGRILALGVSRGTMTDSASISSMVRRSQTDGEAGQGTSATSGKLPNDGAPIAVRSSGAFQSSVNSGSSYGVPYGFGSRHGEPSFSTVSNSLSSQMNRQPVSAANTKDIRSATRGMFLDGLNIGPGSLFPVYPNGEAMNSTGTPGFSLTDSPQSTSPSHLSSVNELTTSGSSLQPRIESSTNVSQANRNRGDSKADASSGSNSIRPGNISSPGTGSMINGAMYASPDSILPAAGATQGVGINSNSSLPGWPASRPAQISPLEAYERQRQQLDDEYNRTLEQLDRNNPMSGSRAQY
ncbi:MAG: tetratricopeptide repeat protein, partial [Planctomycetota bacterium]